MATSSVTLKLLVDKKSNRVLFAEASKEFVDFLFYVLSLPAGTIVKLLTKEGMVGSLGNLYGSIEKLSTNYMLPDYQSKDCILNPTIPKSNVNLNMLMLPKVDQSTRNNMSAGSKFVAFSVSNNTNSAASSSSGEKLGYVKGVVTYTVMDDLVVKPMSTISSITLLNTFNIRDTGFLEEKEVTFVMNEAVKLIKASLESKTVLTHVFLGKRRPTCSA